MSASAGVNATIVGSPALSFYNDVTYIRVQNSLTGAVAYFRKAILNFQCDSGTSFLIGDQDNELHCLYADVARPSSSSLKNLMEVFQAWVEETEADNRESGPFVSDATTTLLDVKTLYNADPWRIDSRNTSATATYDAGLNGVVMNITTTGTSSAIRQTMPYATVLNNKTLYAVVAATLITNVAARNVVAKVGCFNDRSDIALLIWNLGNGIFFQHKSVEGLSLVLRSNYANAASPVDVTVPQASWNMDTLDGNGPSGKVLDPTAENTFVFEWAAFSGSVIKAGYLQDGRPIWCHAFRNVRMGCAALPMRWELAHIDTALASTDNDQATMIQGAGSVFLQGVHDPLSISRGFTGPTVYTVTAENSPLPVLTITPRTDQRGIEGSRVHVRRLCMANLDTGIARWALVLNYKGTDITSAVDVGNTSVPNSFVFVTQTGQQLTGGQRVIASGFLPPGVHIHDIKDDIGLKPFWSGSAQYVTLIVSYVRGPCTVAASMEWSEFE